MKSISSIITKCAHACVITMFRKFHHFFHFSIFAQRPSYLCNINHDQLDLNHPQLAPVSHFMRTNTIVQSTAQHDTDWNHSILHLMVILLLLLLQFQVGSHKEMIPTIWAKRKRIIDVALNYVLLKQTFIKAKRSDLLTVFEHEPRGR